MELEELLSERIAVTIPSRSGGTDLKASFNPEAISQKTRRKIMALQGTEDESEAVIMMIEAFDVQWNLKKGGKDVLPVSKLPADLKAEIDAATPEGDEPEYPPVLGDVSIKALATILQLLTESAAPKETGIGDSSPGSPSATSSTGNPTRPTRSSKSRATRK